MTRFMRSVVVGLAVLGLSSNAEAVPSFTWGLDHPCLLEQITECRNSTGSSVLDLWLE